jgi:hypothetical protein
MLKTKRMLHNLTDSELLALPQMENTTKIAAMKLLARLTFIAFRMNERKASWRCSTSALYNLL